MAEFAKEYELILFVSDERSSNGKLLYNICKENNTNSFFISDIEDIDSNWFTNINKTGISGATSTPTWLMEKVKKYIEENIV
jgi:4-hydroxy-3-methylbut-2-enyl diphosphate reductase